MENKTTQPVDKQKTGSENRNHSMFTLKFQTTHHAEDRILERVGIQPEELLSIVNSGRGILLTNPYRHTQQRGAILVFGKKANAHFVVVFALNEKHEGIVVTVLTQEQFENDIGHRIDIGIRKRAVRAVCTQQEFSAWRDYNLELHPEDITGSDKQKKKPRLEVIHISSAGRSSKATLPYLPDEFSKPTAWTINALFGLPGFPQWFDKNLREKGVLIDQVSGINLLIPGSVREPINIC